MLGKTDQQEHSTEELLVVLPLVLMLQGEGVTQRKVLWSLAATPAFFDMPLGDGKI